MLKTYGEAGLVFNSDKFQFCQNVVRFAGLDVTERGVQPARDFLDAILQLPTPNNISDVRAFFRMMNQVSYAFSMLSVMEPFRHLLKPGNAFIWSPLLQERFKNAKRNVTSAVKEGVQHFEINRPTCIATDWSTGGLRFTLRQKWC